MIDLTIQRFRYAERAVLVPRSAKGTAWLSDKTIGLGAIELDTPVTLSLEGADELDAMARGDGLETEGL